MRSASQSLVSSVRQWSGAAVSNSGSGYIASRLYDSVFFIFAPVLAFLLVEFLANWDWALERHSILGTEQTPALFFIAIWTHAHLFAVVFRSHANPKVFPLHRFAFIGVPILLFVGFLVSIMNGSTETTFYVIAVYFGSVAIRRTRHAVAAGLFADFVGVVASVIICTLMFG